MPDLHPFFWLAVILISGGTALCITWPLRKKLHIFEQMLETLSRAVREAFGKK